MTRPATRPGIARRNLLKTALATTAAAAAQVRNARMGTLHPLAHGRCAGRGRTTSHGPRTEAASRPRVGADAGRRKPPPTRKSAWLRV